MPNAETITVFLMDGDENGRIKASIENWTGLGYKIPREKLDDCATISYLNQSSVYFLFGTSENGKPPVYIGQAVSRKNGKGILARLKEHDANPDKNYWTDAIVFTTKDNSFGPTELSYLENLFCNMAHEASRYEVKNANDPNSGNITEEKESALSKYATYAKLILGVFGYKVFSPLATYEKKPLHSLQPVLPVNAKRLGNLDAVVLLAGGISSSSYLKQHLIDIGYMDEKCCFTIAKINKDGKRFWANPPIEYLDTDWVLALNDVNNRILYIFRLPGKSIDKKDVKTRIFTNKSGNRVCIDLEIVQQNEKFVCIASGIEYQKWLSDKTNY